MLQECAARDAAMAQALNNAGLDWREQVTVLVRTMDGDVTGEDIRLACQAEGIGPHHHNAWGGMVCSLIRDGVLVPTGRYVPMKAEGSHARKTQVYRIVR